MGRSLGSCRGRCLNLWSVYTILDVDIRLTVDTSSFLLETSPTKSCNQDTKSK